MASLSQFRTRISQKLGLDNTAAGAEQTLIDSWVNEGVVDILMEVQPYTAEATASLTAGSGDYLLDSNILIVKDVFYTSGGLNYTLEHTSPDAIIQYRSVTNVAVGPARYYAFNGANNLMLFPLPSTGDTLTFWYVPRPTALANASDDPSSASLGGIPTEWHKAIEFYALWQGGDYIDDDSSQQGERYHQQYESWLKRIRKERTLKTGRLLGPIIPGRKRKRYIPHDNSTDTGFLN